MRHTEAAYTFKGRCYLSRMPDTPISGSNYAGLGGAMVGPAELAGATNGMVTKFDASAATADGATILPSGTYDIP